MPRLKPKHCPPPKTQQSATPEATVLISSSSERESATRSSLAIPGTNEYANYSDYANASSPEGTFENSPAVHCRVKGKSNQAPKRRLKEFLRPSLRDSCVIQSVPGVETPGYSQRFLRNQIATPERSKTKILSLLSNALVSVQSRKYNYEPNSMTQASNDFVHEGITPSRINSSPVKVFPSPSMAARPGAGFNSVTL